MNLMQAIEASPYRTAICETQTNQTYTVRPNEDYEAASLEDFEIVVQQGAMPATVVGEYHGLAALIASLDNYTQPKADDSWLPIGENGDVLEDA
jgi:hypothetical protein